jgi:glycopeptide antibiotics resistance protein
VDWYGRDALVNLIGFAPLGFFAVAAARRRGRVAPASAVAGALVLGAALSLGIELIQVQLPARVSSATDVAFNVVGTALGAWLALQGPIATLVFGAATAETEPPR